MNKIERYLNELSKRYIGLDIGQFKLYVFLIFFTSSFLSFAVGVNAGVFFKTCKPESIAAYVNIPYRVGCELTLRRWGER